MKPYQFVYLLSLLASLVLPACQSKQDPVASPPVPPKSYLKLTFEGTTRTYADVSLTPEGQIGQLASWQITAGSDEDNYLTIALFGKGGGTYPYKQAINDYSQVSQIEYKTPNSTYTNYKPIVCPAYSASYYSTVGQVKLEQYVAGKLAKGTFTGALLDAESLDNCTKESKPFSGEFYVVNP